MKQMKSTTLVLFSVVAYGAAFDPSQPSLSLQANVASIRGGGSSSALDLTPTDIVSAVTGSIQAGPYGVLALTSVASSVCIPLTQVKKLYGIGVGYGFSVAAMSFTLLQSFDGVGAVPTALAYAAIAYGIRLGGFLLLRDQTSAKKLPPDTSDRLQRIPFAVSLSLFYAGMTHPILYVLRNCGCTAPSLVTIVGVTLAWLGVVMEAAADGQKYLVKRQVSSSSDAFVGPTTGVYQITRHPNYTGEVLFWLGTWTAGLPYFGGSVVGWATSSLGLVGIVSIMRGATRKLEEKQAEKYKGQASYDKWTEDVIGPLYPFVSFI